MTHAQPRFTTRTAPQAAATAAPTSTDQGGTFAVTMTGELDLVAEPALTRLVDDFRDSGMARATVDVRAVEFLDTAGLTFLARLRQVSLERGGTVGISGASGACLRILRLVGFDAVFDLEA